MINKNMLQPGLGLAALKEFKAETGLVTREIASMLGVPVPTVFGWLDGNKPDPPHDLMLFRAVRDMRREYAAGNEKAKETELPICQYCGDQLPLTSDGRKIKSDHTCLSGYRHILPKRTHDLALRALTPIVRNYE